METLPREAFEGGRLRRAGRWAVCFYDLGCPYCIDFLPMFVAHPATAGTELALADLSDYADPRWESCSIAVVPSILGFDDGALRFRIDGIRGVGLDSADLARMDRAWTGRPGPRD